MIQASGGAVVKNLPANPGDTRDAGSDPGWGRFPGEGNGNPLEYYCVENPMDIPWTIPEEPGWLRSIGTKSWT